MTVNRGSWLIVAAAVVVAIPFGYALGVVAVSLLAGPDIGQMPVMSVPIAILGSIIFALLPVLTPRIRLTILAAGAVVLILVMRQL